MDHIKKQMKASAEYRQEAVQLGLAYDWPNEIPKRYFSFYLNMAGDLHSPQDPMTIIKLVMLGRKYEDDGLYDHSAILRLYGNSERLAEGADQVYWDYPMNTLNPVMLADWLLKSATPSTKEEKWEFHLFLCFVYEEVYRKPVPFFSSLFWWL